MKSGKVRLVKGDALIQADVQRAWGEASTTGTVDLLLFTVGKFHTGLLFLPLNSKVLIKAACRNSTHSKDSYLTQSTL